MNNDISAIARIQNLQLIALSEIRDQIILLRTEIKELKEQK